MKKYTLHPRTILAFSLGVVAVALLSFPASAQNRIAVASGDWNSDIWTTSINTPPQGVWPIAGFNATIGNGVHVTVDTEVLGSGSLNALVLNTGELTMKSGAAINTDNFNSQHDSTTTIGSGATLTVGGNGMRVGNGSGGTVRVQGGTVKVSGDIFTVAGGNGSTALLEVSGGGVTHDGASLWIAASRGSRGMLRVNGGSVTAKAIQFTTHGTILEGTLDLQSGSIVAEAFVAGDGAANASFLWTGGTLSVGRSDLNIDNSGTGDFAVGGVDAVGTFVVPEGTSISYTQGPKASLTLDIASDRNFDTFALESNSSCTVTLGGKLNINFLERYNPPAGTTFDVISATNIIDQGITLGGDAASRFTFKIIKNGEKEVLRLTAIP